MGNGKVEKNESWQAFYLLHHIFLKVHFTHVFWMYLLDKKIDTLYLCKSEPLFFKIAVVVGTSCSS